MRLTRAALVVAAGALAPALLLSTPSFATTTATASVPVTASAATEPTDEDNAVAIAAAAGQALDGTPEEMRYFLEVGQYEVDG